MKKAIEFGRLEKLIQDYANEHCEGNFSMAARKLVEKGLSFKITNTSRLYVDS
jgi:hypothetical protein